VGIALPSEDNDGVDASRPSDELSLEENDDDDDDEEEEKEE